MNTRGLRRMQQQIFESVAVASAGTTHEDATALSEGGTVFLVSGAANAGVRLPMAKVGKVIFIKNVTATILKVYNCHNDAAYINAVAPETAYAMAASTSCVFICATNQLWYTWPLVAS